MYVYNKNQITINVIVDYKPNNKHMYLRLRGETLYISSYKRLKPSQINFLIDENIVAIKKLMNKRPKIEQRNSIHLFGEEYGIDVVLSKFNKIELQNSRMTIFTKKDEEDYVRDLVNRYLVSLAKDYIESRLEIIKKDFADLEVEDLKFNYKYLKTCYGKCSPKKRMITFSGICSRVEKKYIDYVIYHEFCHLKYLGHQADFYNYLDSKLNNGKKLAKEIRKIKYQDKY